MTKTSNHRKIRNSKGFSLVEVMIAVGIMGVVGLGLTSLLTEMGKQQNAANIKALLSAQKLKIEALVKDSIAWSKMINNTANDGKPEYTCLRPTPIPALGCADNSSTVDPFGGVLDTLVMSETNGNVFFDPTGATNGFSAKGTNCTTYSSTACPIRWSIRVIHQCQTTSPCLTPTVRVIAKPVMTAAVQEALNLAINPDNYKVDVTRGVGTRFDPILVTEVLTGAGAGPCSGGSVTRNMNRRIQDPANNVTIAGGQITFQPGSYQCRITAPAFKVGTHFIEWETSAGVVCTGCRGGPSSSPQRYSVPSNAQLEVVFVISSTTTYRVRHRCQYSTYPSPVFPGETTLTSQQLGFTTAVPAQYGSTEVTYATVSCYRNG
ncbi:MAG: prepilin-type N-terminal cleavage/methylation domain-containing protein [Bdellovibrionota bacterium]